MKTKSPQHRLALACLALAPLPGLFAHADPAERPAGAAPPSPIASVRVIGRIDLPRGHTVRDARVGGLSGLEYDRAADRWLAISDDKGAHGPARYFTLRLDYDETGFHSAGVCDMQPLLQPNKQPYPDAGEFRGAGGEIPDLEAIRLDPLTGTLWYSSEGDGRIPLPMFVREARRDGAFIADLPLPEMFQFSAERKHGPRHNLACEGFAFAPDGKSLWFATEGPLYEDGAPPSATTGALVRVTQLTRAGRVLRQIAWPLGPVAASLAQGKPIDNGLAEILAMPGGRLLGLERSGGRVDGKWCFSVSLYEADTTGATDISGIASLASSPGVKPAAKRLLLDFASTGAEHIDNIEGLAHGRRLANGHDTLVAVSDDNFGSRQITQLWALEIIPPPAPDSAAAARPKRNWDDAFDGVVHDGRRIAGFAGEYRWLSNYFPCPVTYEGRAYGSTEAAYHASKFPESERDEFTKLDPDASKKLSRKKPFDTAAWNARKVRVMREITWAKYTQHPELAAKLLATGERELEETNWWGDRFWGVAQGEGQNMLGRILMDARDRLAAAATP
ncbi:MAG: esterase-like activity of phytase family protein [Opitutaceae bacterium]|jgi:ribA/ribD-fused uncharacterized protein|nr:esterase-like activity of phytase family protein [Opitutaceae bacterium]